jgi:hypothetical protein
MGRCGLSIAFHKHAYESVPPEEAWKAVSKPALSTSKGERR